MEFHLVLSHIFIVCYNLFTSKLVDCFEGIIVWHTVIFIMCMPYSRYHTVDPIKWKPSSVCHTVDAMQCMPYSVCITIQCMPYTVRLTSLLSLLSTCMVTSNRVLSVVYAYDGHAHLQCSHFAYFDYLYVFILACKISHSPTHVI